MDNMIKVIVYSSKLNTRPTIEVPENATKLDLKNALAEASIDYSGLSFTDGMNQQELKGDSSIITTKAGKALLTITPKRNKAGGNLSFSELRSAAKIDNFVKDAFIKRASELGKNWTQLKTIEMQEAYTKLNQSVDEAELQEPVMAVTCTEVVSSISEDSHELSKEIIEPRNTRGLSPEMKEEIRNYINQILLEKEELEFKAVLNSMESYFADNNEDEDEDEYYA